MMTKYLGILMVWCFALNSYAQQAWTQPKGDAYMQLGASYHSYDDLFVENGETKPLPYRINQTVAVAYAEYGITDRLTANIVLPFQFVSTADMINADFDQPIGGNGVGELYAWGNIELGATYNWLKKNNGLVISSKINAALNTSSRVDRIGLQSGFNAYTISPSFLIGLGKDAFFTSGELGLAYMTNDYNARYFLNAQLGKKFTRSQRLMGILAFSINAPITDSTVEQNKRLDGWAENTGLYLNESAFYATTFKVGYEFIPDWTAWFSLGGGVGLGVNVGQNFVYSFAIGHQL